MSTVFHEGTAKYSDRRDRPKAPFLRRVDGPVCHCILRAAASHPKPGRRFRLHSVSLPAAILLAAALCQAAVPTPKEHLGYTPGDDYKLADYNDIISYFQKLTRASDRIQLAEFGKTAMGKPMYIAYISAPENLKKLDLYRGISRRLALGEPDEAEARRLADQGKAIVWIDSGLHASEVAPAQHSPELAYRMLTDEGAEAEAIRRQVILLQIPVINPDGLRHTIDWFKSLSEPQGAKAE